MHVLAFTIPFWVTAIITALFLFVCVLLILAVLIQRPAGGGLSGAFGSGAGSGQTAFGAKTGDALTIATIAIFFVYLLVAVGLNFAARPGSTVAAAATAGGTQGGAGAGTGATTPPAPTGTPPAPTGPQPMPTGSQPPTGAQPAGAAPNPAPTGSTGPASTPATPPPPPEAPTGAAGAAPGTGAPAPK